MKCTETCYLGSGVVVNDEIPVISTNFIFCKSESKPTMTNTNRKSPRSHDDTHKEDARVSTVRRLRRIKRRLFLAHAHNADVAVTIGTRPNQMEACAIRQEERERVPLSQ